MSSGTYLERSSAAFTSSPCFFFTARDYSIQIAFYDSDTGPQEFRNCLDMGLHTGSYTCFDMVLNTRNDTVRMQMQLTRENARQEIRSTVPRKHLSCEVNRTSMRFPTCLSADLGYRVL